MKLIVGLGNPGKEYENTRHNMGFTVIDHFASSNNIILDKKKFDGLYNSFIFNGEKVILLKPLSYMNLSGEVVRKFVDYFGIGISDILIISDDLDLNFLSYRLRASGSSGGHNGLKNIALHLGTENYKRLKIGISNNKMIDTKDYVLGHFSEEEKNKINDFLEISDNILFDFLRIDFVKLMNQYNKR